MADFVNRISFAEHILALLACRSLWDDMVFNGVFEIHGRDSVGCLYLSVCGIAGKGRLVTILLWELYTMLKDVVCLSIIYNSYAEE